MNGNNNNKELNNYPWYLDIPHPQLYYSFSSNQSHPIIPEQQPQKQQQEEEEQSQQQQEKQRKKSRGNRRLQRSRRKLRKQGINADAMARSTGEPIDIELSKSYQIEQPNIGTTTVLVTEPVFRSKTIISKKYIKNKQQQRRNTILKQKTNISRITTMGPMQLSATTTTTESSKNTSTTTNTSFDSIDVSNETVYEMLLKAFNEDTEKLIHYLNGSQNIQFARDYINLISRLSYVKLKQSQWNWYHHIGMTRNIWTIRIPKHIAERNSICYTYGRSQRIIEQRRQKIQQQLQETQNALQLFEQQILYKSMHPINCCSELQALSSILHTFTGEHQQKMRDELEFKREELILDAIDHQLVHKFFSLKPMKSQILSARRIWQATVKQTMIDEEITLLEHRLHAKQQLSSTPTLLDLVINNIDATLNKQEHSIEPNGSNNCSSPEFAKMDQLKHDIIHQSISAARQMKANFVETALHEEEKSFRYENNDEYTSTKQVAIKTAIEIRRLHMIERAQYITRYKLIK